LQRLFTTFAGGWPGFGLLVQRLVTGIALLHHALGIFKETPSTATITTQGMGAVLAIFITIGLWTPIAGALILAIEMQTALLHPGNAETAILLATLGATSAMIGPGALSIEARLFGRKQIGG
jgi:putative oxidoreductase